MPASPHSLQELRDVHLPDPVSWWPPAPGWWIVAGLVVLSALICVWMIKNWRKTKPRRTAIAELRVVSESYHPNQNDQWVVQRLSEIIRRYAMTAFPRAEVAGLTGNAWLQFLDRTGQTNQFTEGAGRLLKSEPYRSQTTMSATELMMLVKLWIHRVPPSNRGTNGRTNRGKTG
jgi:hypothetical protein